MKEEKKKGTDLKKNKKEKKGQTSGTVEKKEWEGVLRKGKRPSSAGLTKST